MKIEILLQTGMFLVAVITIVYTHIKIGDKTKY